MIDRLFFYGTLMSDESRGSILPAYIARPSGGPATIRGDLYVAGGGSFPALMPSDDGVVTGEVWQVVGGTRSERTANLIRVLRTCDMIEGYDPARVESSMYIREAVDLLDGYGRVWTYRWNGANARYLGPRIESGSWREYVARRRAVIA